MKRRLLVLALLFGVLSVPAWAEEGSLLLIGGGSRPPAVMKKFVELAGGPDALILVIPSASELPDAGTSYEKEFRKMGCRRVRALDVRTRRQAMAGNWEPLFAQAGGIYFTGGDQVRLLRICGNTPLSEALRRAHARGAAIGGTSAGTACMSLIMITGDGNPAAICYDSRALSRGFGLFPGVIVDQHFVVRKRLNRLIAAVVLHRTELGVGVDESTAVWRRPDGSLEVLGEGSVVIVDASAASRVRQGPRHQLGFRDVRIHVLLPGETWPAIQERKAPEGARP